MEKFRKFDSQKKWEPCDLDLKTWENGRAFSSQGVCQGIFIRLEKSFVIGCYGLATSSENDVAPLVPYLVI